MHIRNGIWGARDLVLDLNFAVLSWISEQINIILPSKYLAHLTIDSIEDSLYNVLQTFNIYGRVISILLLTELWLLSMTVGQRWGSKIYRFIAISNTFAIAQRELPNSSHVFTHRQPPEQNSINQLFSDFQKHAFQITRWNPWFLG